MEMQYKMSLFLDRFNLIVDDSSHATVESPKRFH